MWRYFLPYPPRGKRDITLSSTKHPPAAGRPGVSAATEAQCLHGVTTARRASQACVSLHGLSFAKCAKHEPSLACVRSILCSSHPFVPLLPLLLSTQLAYPG
eukprot:5231949-Pyramimonas_sp.AAC.1